MKLAKAIRIFCILSSLALFGCATESHRAEAPLKTKSFNTPFAGKKSKVVVGKFGNRSNYMRGIFSDGVDRLGGQGKNILITHLQSSGRFSVFDRQNMDESAKEASFNKVKQNIKGADFTITGGIAEFGRKEVGDVQLFGILGSGKQQVAYSKVNLNIIDVQTSEVIYSVQGAGNYKLSSREVLGFGGRAGYDSTLNGKVLDLAIREAVNRLVEAVEQGKIKKGQQ